MRSRTLSASTRQYPCDGWSSLPSSDSSRVGRAAWARLASSVGCELLGCGGSKKLANCTPGVPAGIQKITPLITLQRDQSHRISLHLRCTMEMENCCLRAGKPCSLTICGHWARRQARWRQASSKDGPTPSQKAAKYLRHKNLPISPTASRFCAEFFAKLLILRIGVGGGGYSESPLPGVAKRRTL